MESKKKKQTVLESKADRLEELGTDLGEIFGANFPWGILGGFGGLGIWGTGNWELGLGTGN